MKKGRFVLILLLCIVVFGLAWMLVVTEKPAEEVQSELIAEAEALIADKIYIRAETVLDEAVACSDVRRLDAEQLLKVVYRALIEDVGYGTKLDNLYAAQLKRTDLPVSLYFEIADYYFEDGDRKQGIQALRLGSERTGDQTLVDRYEKERYSFEISGELYDDVTEVYNGYIQVQRLDLWGLADHMGNIVVPCDYEKISTFSADQAVVKSGNETFTIDAGNHRLYLLKSAVKDFGNYGNGLIAFQTDAGWVRGNGEFTMGSMAFEEIGMYNGGYAAAKLNGKWGVIDTNAEWVITPDYDEIIMDGIGRCWEQNAVFARSGSEVILFIEWQPQQTTYEDAWPFYEEGWAAVKKDGKWGFIDAQGQLMIPYQYQDARSFGGHLAPVLTGELWGYISRNNQLVIDDQYYDVRGFVNGVAAAKNMDGWQFLILDEYRED